MDRDRALPLALAVVAILALALSAATLDSAVVPGASGAGGDDDGFGFHYSQSENPKLGGGAPGNASGAGPLPLSNCWPVVREPPVLAGLGLLFVGLFGAVYRSTRSAFAGVVVCGGVGVPVGLVWAALAVCPPPQTPGGGNASGLGARNWTDNPAGGAGGLGRTGVETLASPTGLLVLLVAVALAVVAVAVLASGHDDDAGSEPEPDGDPDATAERIGRVAGAAADRIDADDAVDPDNEVYRAWREMTDAVDVDSPDTTTPREFERAAVAAGMTREDVAALTDLFEAVRYGGREATADTERRAVETLRRIESSYGGD